MIILLLTYIFYRGIVQSWAAQTARRKLEKIMTRWIDMTDAQKVATQQRNAAKRRAEIVANPSAIIKALADIDAESAAIAEGGGKYATKQALRFLEEKQPIFDTLARLNIDPKEIGIGNQSPAFQRQRERLAANPTLVGDIVAVARAHGLEFARSLIAA
jgi:hypothetical protein